MNTDKPACLACRFFDPLPDRPVGGLCRRRAPIRLGWPKVIADDWCGEFEIQASQDQVTPDGHEFLPGNDGRPICLCGQRTTDDPRRCPRTISVDDIELGSRARRMARHLSARTLGDLMDLGEQRMLSFPNFGVHSLDEITTALEKYGLTLKP